MSSVKISDESRSELESVMEEKGFETVGAAADFMIGVAASRRRALARYAEKTGGAEEAPKKSKKKSAKVEKAKKPAKKKRTKKEEAAEKPAKKRSKRNVEKSGKVRRSKKAEKESSAPEEVEEIAM